MRFQESECGAIHPIGGGHGADAGNYAAEGAAGRRKLTEQLVEIGLDIVHEVRGPMRLWDFTRRLGQRLGMPALPAGKLCDAVKAALERIDDPRLRVLAPSMQGVGYVYDAEDLDSWPVRHCC